MAGRKKAAEEAAEEAAAVEEAANVVLGADGKHPISADNPSPKAVSAEDLEKFRN